MQKLDTHEVQKSDTHKVHLQKKTVKNAVLQTIIKSNTHEVHLQKKIVKNALLQTIIKSDTHGVHLQKKTVKNVPLHTIIKLDTHGVHLWKKVVKNESFTKLFGYAQIAYSSSEGRQEQMPFFVTWSTPSQGKSQPFVPTGIRRNKATILVETDKITNI